MEIYECPKCKGIAIPVHWTGDWLCICCADCGEKTGWYYDINEALEAWEKIGKEKNDERRY